MSVHGSIKIDKITRVWVSRSLQLGRLACLSLSWTTARSHWTKALRSQVCSVPVDHHNSLPAG
jgi:hypothetical protein